MRKVKRCAKCGCLFICEEPFNIVCKKTSICMCNDCEIKINPENPEICNITIIKSGNKSRGFKFEES